MMACSAFKLRLITTGQSFILKNCAARPVFLKFRYFSVKNDNGNKDAEKKTEGESLNEKEAQSTESSSEIKTSSTKSETHLASSSEETKNAAKKKLLSLLSEIKVSSDYPNKTRFSLNLSRPLKRISKKERFPELTVEESSPDKELKMAVKAVASHLSDDPERVEAELNEKLSSISMTKESVVVSEDEKDIKSVPGINEEVSKNVMSSVEEVAAAVTDSPAPVKSELVRRLLRLSIDSKTSEKKSISHLFEGMKIEGTTTFSEKKQRTEQMRTPELSNETATARRFAQDKQDLFGSSPLGIFATDKENEIDRKSSLWEDLQNKELRLLVQFAPSNAFEEMILWTEQGKHWKFPIDNEIDIGAEENVGFNEHVFLDHHLEGFPTKGPIRHFMELVIVGLTKNPYITVERKIENIHWFKNYFQEKEEILKECGAIE